MDKFIIVYASMSGNTEKIASTIADGIREEGLEVEYHNAENISARDLEHFDGIILGSYTWGDGELADEFLKFYTDMDELNLSGKKAAVFGSGDRAFVHFCRAVATLEEKLKEKGAQIVQEGLRIENEPSPKEKEVCKEFGKAFVKAVLATVG